MSQTKEKVEADLQAFQDANGDWMSVKWKTEAVTAFNNRLATFPTSAEGIEYKFNFGKVKPSPALEKYIETGNRLKAAGSVATVERGLDHFVKATQDDRVKGQTSVFAYLDGSSGLGKTQLAFALSRSVLFIPLSNSQSIYKCFDAIREVVNDAVRLDLVELRKENEHYFSAQSGVGIFTATHIECALGSNGHLKFFTVSVLLKLLEFFALQPRVSGAEIRGVTYMTNVFLGADGEVKLQPMAVLEGRRVAEKYRDVLIHLDEIPPKDDVTAYDKCMFLRNLIRTLALPCLLSGTESTLLDVVTTVNGSRTEGRTSWAWLLTKFPAPQLDVPIDRFSDYEQHLLSNTRPLFSQWFAECSGGGLSPSTAADATAPEKDAAGRIRMTPETLSAMKHKICKAKLNVLPSNRLYDRAWLHASTLLVFADSLEGCGEVKCTLPTDSAAQSGKKRTASDARLPQDAWKKQKIGGIGNNVMHHSLLIRKHFALLYVPTQLVDENGMCVLNLQDGSMHTSDEKKFLVKAAFQTCTEDPLLYLACLRGGLVCRGPVDADGEFVQVPSSYAFNTFRVQSGVGNSQAKSNDGTGLEAESMAAFVLAAHRYTSFKGTPYFRWLSLVIAELSTKPDFEEVEITAIPEELKNALQDVMVPLLSPPNCPWGEDSMQSGINFGNLSWCKNTDKKDASVHLTSTKASSSAQEEDTGGGEGGVLFPPDRHMLAHGGYTAIEAECKDELHFGGSDILTVTKKVANHSVSVLIGADLSAWRQTTVRKFPPGVSVYRMNTKGSIECVSEPVAAADWKTGRKILIALDLKHLYPGRYAAAAHST